VAGVDELDRFLDEARLAEAALARQQERWLRQVDEDDASLVGTLVDLAERGSTISIETEPGVIHRGIVRLVGQDFCVVRSEREETWIAYEALAVIRPDTSEQHAPASGNRVAADIRLVDGLAMILADRPRLTLLARGSARLAGALVGVGRDVVSLRLDGPEGQLAYVPAASLRTETNVNQIG
jgi:hypothetical protein